MGCYYITIAFALVATITSVAWLRERARRPGDDVHRDIVDQEYKDSIILALRQRRLIEKLERHKKISKSYDRD